MGRKKIEQDLRDAGLRKHRARKLTRTRRPGPFRRPRRPRGRRAKRCRPARQHLGRRRSRQGPGIEVGAEEVGQEADGENSDGEEADGDETPGEEADGEEAGSEKQSARKQSARKSQRGGRRARPPPGSGRLHRGQPQSSTCARRREDQSFIVRASGPTAENDRPGDNPRGGHFLRWPRSVDPPSRLRVIVAPPFPVHASRVDDPRRHPVDVPHRHDPCGA